MRFIDSGHVPCVGGERLQMLFRRHPVWVRRPEKPGVFAADSSSS